MSKGVLILLISVVSLILGAIQGKQPTKTRAIIIGVKCVCLVIVLVSILQEVLK